MRCRWSSRIGQLVDSSCTLPSSLSQASQQHPLLSRWQVSCSKRAHTHTHIWQARITRLKSVAYVNYVVFCLLFIGSLWLLKKTSLWCTMPLERTGPSTRLFWIRVIMDRSMRRPASTGLMTQSTALQLTTSSLLLAHIFFTLRPWWIRTKDFPVYFYAWGHQNVVRIARKCLQRIND